MRWALCDTPQARWLVTYRGQLRGLKARYPRSEDDVATKVALNAMTNSLSVEPERYGITADAILRGWNAIYLINNSTGHHTGQTIMIDSGS